MSFQIKKKKNRDIFIKFFAERFPDHVRTGNLDYMGVWVSRFNNKACYWNADSNSERILKSQILDMWHYHQQRFIIERQ
jgi:hypothetical protein